MPPESIPERLLDRARGDQTMLRTLAADAKAPDCGVGFHAQQAVEKALKAVLVASRVRPPRTHDLARRAQLAIESGLTLPAEPGALNDYTGWAATERYEQFTANRPLDRDDAEAMVALVVEWAEASLDGGKD